MAGRWAIDRLIRREARILAALCAIALAGFFATRALASFNRRIARADAARWQAVGAKRLAAGEARAAVDAFRTASLMDRSDRGHRLALADALRRTGDNAGALDVLERLREGYPEDVDINRGLARLEAARGNVEDAVRYYQTAVLGLWQPASLDERRTLRIELIAFLLDHGATARALAEALKVSGEIPDDPSAHVTAGRLLLRSGSASRAEAQFVAALRLNPHDDDAIAGAGEAAFQTGDYERAREFLVRAPDKTASAGMLAIVDLVLANDPLLPHLTARDRSRRLSRALDALAARAAGCPGGAGLRHDIAALQQSLADRRATSADSLGADFAHIARLARSASVSCAPDQSIDQAIVLIARRHGLEPQ